MARAHLARPRGTALPRRQIRRRRTLRDLAQARARSSVYVGGTLDTPGQVSGAP